MSQTSSIDALVQQAVQTAQQARYPESLALCEQIAATGALPPLIEHVMGVSLVNLGRIGEGIEHLKAAVVAKPERPWMETLGNVYQMINHMEQAFAVYEALLNIYPDGLDATFHRIYTDALKRSQSMPFPLARRQRFAALAELFTDTMQQVQEGDVVECGCFRGHSTLILSQYWQQLDPSFDGTGFIVCDSFEGLSDPSDKDTLSDDHPDAARLKKITVAGNFAADLEAVQQNLSDFPGIRWVRGWIPASLAELPEDATYRFVNVDVDIYEPTHGAFAYFWPKLVPGGVITTDDYNWPGARQAVDEVMAGLEEGSYTFTVTPHNQAILKKTG